MKVIVMNRPLASQYSLAPHSETSVIISITDPQGPPNFFCRDPANGIKDILRVSFEDTDKAETSISKAQAREIAIFVQQHMTIDKIIVHCEAGQSRSAGVAAAILKYIFNDDSSIFECPKYTPNMFVYRKVIESLYEMEEQ